MQCKEKKAQQKARQQKRKRKRKKKKGKVIFESNGSGCRVGSRAYNFLYEQLELASQNEEFVLLRTEVRIDD